MPPTKNARSQFIRRRWMRLQSHDGNAAGLQLPVVLVCFRMATSMAYVDFPHPFIILLFIQAMRLSPKRTTDPVGFAREGYRISQHHARHHLSH